MIEIKRWKQVKEFLFNNTFKDMSPLNGKSESKQNAKNTKNQLKAYKHHSNNESKSSKYSYSAHNLEMLYFSLDQKYSITCFNYL